MGENTAIDQFYNQQLNEYLESEEYICPIVDYKGETLDIAWDDIFQLESSSTTYVFREKESVEFFDWVNHSRLKSGVVESRENPQHLRDLEIVNKKSSSNY